MLDLGCGAGVELAWLVERGLAPPGAFGVDRDPSRVRAAGRAHRACAFAAADGAALPFRDAAFDVVLLYTVLSSVADPAVQRRLAAEAARVLKTGGVILWYDMRWPSPSNRAVRPLGRRRLRTLFQGFEVQARGITLLPPLARRLGAATGALYPALARVPALRSHLLALLARPREAAA